MWDKLKSTDRGTLAVGSIICSIVFFIALNAFSSVLFTSARLDLTEDGLFTLSAGTKQVLTEIDEPIDLRLYYSKSLDEIGPQISRHAIRVRELLEEFAKLSGGMVRVEYFDPRPFSTEEDLAVGDDVQGLPLDQSGAQVYFGLAGTNSTDDVDAVGYLAPERASFLEYDLTRLVNNLANPEKAAVGLLTDLPVQGTRQDEFQPWLILEALRQFFDVRIYDRDEAELDDDLELLVIAQPHAVNDRMMYSIDQFALNGGKVLAFLDPLAETMALAGPFAGQLPPPGVAIAGMRPLLEQWGVEMPMATFVGDANAAQRVAAPGPQGRQVAVDFLSWLVFQGDHFNREDPVSAQLQRIVLNSAGSVSQRDGATTSFEPLIWSSKVAQRIDVFKLAQRPDPVQIAKDFQSEGKSFTIAARVIGPITTAYPDGPPQAVLDAIEDAAASDALKAAHLAESKTPFNMIIVTDADMLADNNWVQSQDLLGRQLTVPIANNADFAINALDNLHGSAALSGLRGRGLSVRPFDVIEQMEQDAELQFREKEQRLLAEIEEINATISRTQEEDQGAGVVLTSQQQAEIDGSRRRLLALRDELRAVQRSLREDVEELEETVRLVNIWAVPVGVALFAIVLALFRRQRAARYHAAEG